MRRHPSFGLVPWVVVDRDRRLHGRTLLNVPVVGAIEDIDAICERYEINQVLLTVWDDDGSIARQVTDRLSGTDVAIRVLSPEPDWLFGKASLHTVHDLQ